MHLTLLKFEMDSSKNDKDGQVHSVNMGLIDRFTLQDDFAKVGVFGFPCDSS